MCMCRSPFLLLPGRGTSSKWTNVLVVLAPDEHMSMPSIIPSIAVISSAGHLRMVIISSETPTRPVYRAIKLCFFNLLPFLFTHLHIDVFTYS